MSTREKSRTTFQSSELSRGSAEVFAAAADHPVEITRRDGESLVLMSGSADRARTALLELAAQLVAVSTNTDGTLVSRMTDHYPWMLALSSADQEACVTDVLTAARASFATGQPRMAIAEFKSWHETATALAAGLGEAPLEWLDDAEKVERP